MMNELISIIVPVYRQNNDYLKMCIDSILSQTYSNIEIIIVNDGMTDENMSLVKSYDDDRIDVIGDKNHGVGAARNLGIDRAKGDYLVFVDSDDYISPDFCQKTYDYAIKYDIDVVITALVRVYPNHKEKVCCEKLPVRFSADVFIDKLMNVQNCVGYMWGKLWRAKAIKEKGIKVNEKLVVAEDAAFCIKSMGQYNRFMFITDALYSYRVNASSATKKYNDKYFDNYNNAMIATKDELVRMGLYENHKGEFCNFAVYHLLMICVNYVFNDDNGLSYHRQRTLLKNILKNDLFLDALKFSNYEDLSKSRVISLWVLKRRMYFIMKIICKVRRRQFK